MPREEFRRVLKPLGFHRAGYNGAEIDLHGKSEAEKRLVWNALFTSIFQDS